jgi:hypothetical protein
MAMKHEKKALNCFQGREKKGKHKNTAVSKIQVLPCGCLKESMQHYLET